MNVRISPAGPSLSAERLEQFEAELGARLPAPYRAFLAATNGGIPEPDHYAIDGHSEGLGDIRRFLSIDAPAEAADLEANLLVFKDRVPAEFLPIGYSSTNDLVCISLRRQDFGTVYYWDSWDESSPDPLRSSGYSNLYEVAPAFDSFLESLRPYETFVSGG